ncbi:hypothetical protein [Muricoccus radiodurans]|uniref:hypothetical protein n=1 Tax=Muricoccus radiodurans TaxID=2231721 RepID=UPI003CF9DFAE
MVHVLAPRPANGKLPMFFNVDSSVGQNAQNSNPEDIMLVQYIMRLTADMGVVNPVTAAFKKVSPTGRMDQVTVDAIRACQSGAKSAPDGRVSKATGYHYGAAFFTIVELNYNLRRRAQISAKWPCLDQMPNCPPILAAAARRALAGQV